MRLADLRARLAEQGCQSVLIKRLAPNDNPKHGIYIAPNLDGLSLLPASAVRTDDGPPKADLDLAWVDDEGSTDRAPQSKLILYPQYPELRISGFVRGSKTVPSAEFWEGKGSRLLFLGIAGRKVFAWAGPGTPELEAEIDAAAKESKLPQVSPFTRLELGVDGKQTLLSRLRGVHESGWLPGETLLQSGERKPNRAQNAGGLTLEAALGIPKDSLSTPDLGGWEVKGYAVPSFESKARSMRVTLMTPEPTGGYYGKEGIAAFLRRYGYPAVDGTADRLNYSICHSVGIPGTRPATDPDGHILTLRLRGFEPQAGERVAQVLDPASGAVELVDERRRVAMSWPFPPLLDHWVGKHSFVVYVPYVKRPGPSGGSEFRYSDEVHLGVGTGFVRFLSAMHGHAVKYDPGMNMIGASTPTPKTHPRSQFRAAVRDLPVLYEEFVTVNLFA